MKAIETNATLTENGQLILDQPLSLAYPNRVRVIILVSEEEEIDDDPAETIVEGLQEGWQQALTDKTRPVSQLWEGLDVE
ncbi:MAG: hypothetical protein SAJ37_06985 [Oscillatoria sp. PMC 1068.18]|nr:hypothetical protein [Oscillatoria sp. PMC 1076.18]MEC4988477.1 hypothetical protein [Oscillatoria sp. PMC 1068.18]